MKPHGTKFEYEEERNADLMRAYREEIAAVSYIRMPDIYHAIVNRPSARFWVSEERAAIVISAMMRGIPIDDMRPLKREMFQEIYRRVLALKQRMPYESVCRLVFRVVASPAPKFYLTPGSAKVIICRIKKAWRAKQSWRKK